MWGQPASLACPERTSGARQSNGSGRAGEHSRDKTGRSPDDPITRWSDPYCSTAPCTCTALDASTKSTLRSWLSFTVCARSTMLKGTSCSAPAADTQ